MADAKPREPAVFEETTFGTGPDWAAAGLAIKLIEPEITIERDDQESENTVERRQAAHDLIPGLKSANSNFGCSIYATASGVNALDQAPAVATTESTIIRAGLGGRVLGFRAALSGTGTATTPIVVTNPGYVNGHWAFAFDASEGKGSFHKVDDASATPALTLLNDLPASMVPPQAADSLFACIMLYSDELSQDHTHANYKTLSWLVQGEHTDDVYEMTGCKPTVGIEGFTAGEKLKFTLDHMVTDWPDVMPVKQVLPGSASGIAPLTVGTGATTTYKLANVGAQLVDVDCRGSTEIALGVTWSKVEGPCGLNGVKGFKTELVPATITIRVAFADPSFEAEYIAGTKKHLLIQVGDQTTNAVGIYAGNLEYAVRPKRIDEGGVTTTELVFRTHEDPGDTTGLTGDNLALRRAPWVFIHAA